VVSSADEKIMSRRIIILFSVIILVFITLRCKEPSGAKSDRPKKDSVSLVYLNHSDSARYVGIQTCKLCHQDIYNSFIKTGMGKSFDLATKEKSAADYTHATLYDKFSAFHYKAFWQKDSLFFMEYRLEGNDTTFKRVEQVNFIVGSGQHTNSHIQSVNGYFNQMPMTFYTQKKKWDLPPGFEEGNNTHFTRKIGLECMSCHNSYPDFVLGSENKFNSVPLGINCERCHGPGSIHVAQRSTGEKIDTAKYIDYSIVNPAKLSIERQFDICQRCHLQGNAILKEGKSFYDFKPGLKLSDYMSVFLPRYGGADDEFIMASHADRLKQSQCFIKSLEKSKGSNSLKPYQNAMTCVTCHNPHVSVRETNKQAFNQACNNCHQPKGKSNLLCTEKSVVKYLKEKFEHPNTQNSQLNSPNADEGMALSASRSALPHPDCVKCHMPSSGSTDIPHVSVHDHYIRKPISKKEKEKIKRFIGLYAINETHPDPITVARAYISQYDKFEQKPEYLDSAKKYLSDRNKDDLLKNFNALIHLNFSKSDFSQILKYVSIAGEEDLYTSILTKKSYDNLHAWTAYRIAEAFQNSGNPQRSLRWYQRAVELAPFNLDFRNKLGSVYISLSKINEAKKEFEFMLKENPKAISAYTNLGYLELAQNNVKRAADLYNKGMQLNPDYEPLLLNLAGLSIYNHDYKKAISIIERVLKKNPSNVKAKMILSQLKKMV
jgi:tetratricopeptide (TPR) repeat protein